MLNIYSTDIYLEVRLSIILRIYLENKKSLQKNELMYYNTTQNVAIDNNSLTSIEKQRCLMHMQRML